MGDRGWITFETQTFLERQSSMTINNFRDLRVWQSGMDLVEQIYRLTQIFPSHEIYGLSSQVRRCAVSIPSNIAEGHTREHNKEYLYHLSVAQGSLAELQTQIEIARRLEYLSDDQAEHIMEQALSLTRQIYALRNALTKRG
jgi:four helix bundle protein